MKKRRGDTGEDCGAVFSLFYRTKFLFFAETVFIFRMYGVY